ncbi:hypothetical protein PQX77_005882, partial [Marasmius sp. AFHP31]
MSSAKPPARRRSRSSGKSTSSQTQHSRRSTPDESHSPPENIDLSAGPVLKEIAGPDERQRDSGTPKQVGNPELGTRPVHDKEVQDIAPALLDPTSAKEGVLPDHATNKDDDEDKFNADTGPGEQTPLDGTKTDSPAGNKDNAKKAS